MVPGHMCCMTGSEQLCLQSVSLSSSQSVSLLLLSSGCTPAAPCRSSEKQAGCTQDALQQLKLADGVSHVSHLPASNCFGPRGFPLQLLRGVAEASMHNGWPASQAER